MGNFVRYERTFWFRENLLNWGNGRYNKIRRNGNILGFGRIGCIGIWQNWSIEIVDEAVDLVRTGIGIIYGNDRVLRIGIFVELVYL